MIGLALGFLVKYRKLVLIGLCVAAGLVVFNYIDNHGEMKAQIKALQSDNDDYLFDISELNVELAKRNERIARMNERALAQAAAAQLRLEHSQKVIRDLRTEVEKVQKSLAATRVKTLEAMRDDEEFAAWGTTTVPPIAWSLLSESTQGGAND